MNADVREVTRGGREYLVFPVIALREMVIDYPENGTRELLARERLHQSKELWAGTPLTFVHPENDQKTADKPESFTREVIGQVFKPEIIDDEKLKVQAWLDVEKARDLGGLAGQVVEKLRSGENLSVSAGYATIDDTFVDGEHDGEKYNVEQGTILPDHVAVFPSDEFQARCDWEDGCGAPRANYIQAPSDVTLNALEDGDWVQWDWSGGTAYGRVVETVEDGCRSVSGNERCADANSDETVVVVAHYSESGEDQNQRVVKYERNLDPWSGPKENFHENAELCLCLEPEPIDTDQMVTNVEVNGEEIDLTPPEDVQEVAQDFLDAHEEGLIPDSCGTSDTDSTGYQRAQQLASGEELSVSDITAAGSGMYGWFQRHGAQGNQQVEGEPADDESKREHKYSDCGYAAWRAWGGDFAKEWVNEVYQQIKQAQNDSKDNAMTDDTDEDPATLFQKLADVFKASEPEQARANSASESPDGSGDDPTATDSDGEADDPPSDTKTDSSGEAQTTNEDSETGTGDMADSDTDQKVNQETLTVEDLAKHTLFSVETLESMDEDMLKQLEQEVIQELLGSGGSGGGEASSEGEPAQNAQENTEDDTVTDTETNENYVTEEQLDDRLDDFEERVTNSIGETVEEKLDEFSEQKENAEKRAKQARIVANAIDGMSVEAAKELPDDELASLAEKHGGGQRANMAAIPGEMNRNFEETDSAEYEDYPAGRSDWERRNGGE